MSPEHEVLEILARYVRAVDYRDGEAMASLFSPDGQVCVFYNNAGKSELVFKISGPKAIAESISDLMAPHPIRGWSHHTTHDHITRVNGDFATIDAQFVRFDSVGYAQPEKGWPKGSVGVMGTILVTEAGYYFPSFKKIDGEWKIVSQRIYHDLPFAI
jgi:SnoaL-like domain